MTPKEIKKSPLSLKFIGFILKVGTPIFPGAMKRLILNMWQTPPHFQMPERELNAIKSATVTDIPLDNIKIRTWSWGHGPTVLFIHGWGGRGTQACSFIEELNKSGFRVLSLDLPAHGHSTGKRVDYTSMSKAIKAVLNNIDDLHSVITHSFGGLLFANIYHNLLPVKNIIFICPPQSFQTAFNYLDNTINISTKINHQIVNTVKESISEDMMERFSTLKNAAQITQPVLIVHDKDDEVVPVEDGENIAKSIKNCVLHKTEGLGHRKILYDKETIANIIKFINEN